MALAPVPTILIVEDDADVRQYLGELIVGLGYRAVLAADGRQALERVAEAVPDLVITDVTMPGMDGIGLCRTLKSAEATQLVPVLIMTALGSIDDRVAGIQAGADDYLTKPVDHREFLARVETTLRLKQAMDARLEQTRRDRDRLAKFVPRMARRMVAAGPEGVDKQERETSVLFADVSGYVRLASELPAETLDALIQRYFSVFLARIQDAGGDINEMAGDGFMALFLEGDPEQQARAAASCALGILEDAARLNRDAERPLGIHAGVNSGRALVGPTRLAGAGEERWTYTASGPVTNLAARLAQSARAGEVLAGSETARRIAPYFVLQALARRPLRGLGPTAVYRIVAAR
jgi:DNA-binding response OmpR family regulator